MGQSSTTTSATKALPPLQTVMPKCVTSKFMGTWFVIAVKPTMFEKTNSNAVEIYTRTTNTSNKKNYHDIDIQFQYNANTPITSKLKSLPQRGWIIPSSGNNKEESSDWNVSPFPSFIGSSSKFQFHYPILELDQEQYSYCVIGHSKRDYFWIMARTPKMDQSTLDTLLDKLEKKHLYAMDGVRMVPQVWTKEERTKRNLDSVIPDDCLEK